MKNFLYFWILFVAVLSFGLVIKKGVEKSIENQDVMLCESAKVSGNTAYLEKCECYYLKGDIKCLQEKK